jgi:hypothetical protein
MLIAGTMWGKLTPDQRPADLGVNDSGFEFWATDVAGKKFVWNSSAWVDLTSYNGPTTQTQPARALGTVYQNTGTTPRYVLISWNAGTVGARIDAYCDASASPSTLIVDIFVPTANLNGAFTFVVLPNYYYQVVQATATIGITRWTEYQ